MRKALISDFGTKTGLTAAGSWLDIEDIATAEISSEDPLHPFENALRLDTSSGWRALYPGPQLIRLRFDTPQTIRRIHLEFREEQVDRAQEIALFATTTTASRQEIIRQQWVFGASGSTSEVEDFAFDLRQVTLLEIEIDPGRHDKNVSASLQTVQIG